MRPTLRIRPFEYGYHIISFFIVGTRGAVITCVRQYLRTPETPPKRAPAPESFQPPCGKPNANRLMKASLTLTAPASIRRASSAPRFTSFVHTVADRPY